MNWNWKRWFSWHIWPKNDAIQSVYEMVLFFLLLGICWYAYVEMNTVRTVKFEIDAACLKNTRSNETVLGKTYSDILADITITSPMTNNADMLEKSLLDSSNVIIRFIKNDVTSIDSLKYEEKHDSDYSLYWGEARTQIINEYDSLTANRWHLNDVEFLFYSRSTYYDVHNHLSFLTENPFYKLYGEKREYIKNNPLKINKDTSLIISYYSVAENSVSYVGYSATKHVDDRSRVITVCQSQKTPRASVWFLPSGWIYKSTMISKPDWFSLEDISQQYYDVKLRTHSIDSTRLKVDFCGVSEFSQMLPEPDEVGMSYILFTDFEKIEQIEKNGLLFHAKFKELENMQQIRLFLLTSIMAGIIIIIIVFLIISFYKLFRHVRIKPNIGILVVKALLGLFLYSFIYWFIMIRILNGGSIIICNLISIPITIFILWLLYTPNIRRGIVLKLKKYYLNSKRPKNTEGKINDDVVSNE